MADKPKPGSAEIEITKLTGRSAMATQAISAGASIAVALIAVIVAAPRAVGSAAPQAVKDAAPAAVNEALNAAKSRIAVLEANISDVKSILASQNDLIRHLLEKQKSLALILRDASGKVRLDAGVNTETNRIGLVQFDSQGKKRLLLGDDPIGQPSLHLYDGNGNARITLGIGADGKAGIVVRNANGVEVKSLGE